MNNERCSQCSKKLNMSVVGDFKKLKVIHPREKVLLNHTIIIAKDFLSLFFNRKFKLLKLYFIIQVNIYFVRAWMYFIFHNLIIVCFLFSEKTL